ncbi:MAG: VTT domain-containing protein [Candidatus Eisenbacteria bacterium]
MTLNPESLAVLCALLFADGATFSFATTPLLLQYGKFHEPWRVAVFGGTASALGGVLQLLLLRWLLGASQPWMKRLAPSREKLDAALKSYPSTLFLGLVWARLTPLPDAPLKLVAAAIRYSPWRYGLAIYLGAIPYYYLLALVGKKFKIPGWVLLLAVVVIGLGAGLDFWRRRRAAAAAAGATRIPPPGAGSSD